MNAGFPWRKEDLNSHMGHTILETAGFRPREIGLVAHHSSKKHAIGSLCLEEHTEWLYSIKHVFTDPEFRRMGVATKLLSSALFFLRKRGVRKAHLNVDPEDLGAVNLYRKLGFREIGPRMLVGKGYLSKGSRFRTTARTLMGGRYSKLSESNDKLTPLQMSVKENRELLFRIYRRNMGQEWTKFFETTSDNLIYGELQNNRRFYLREVVTSCSTDFFAIVFNRPFLSNAEIEVYGNSESVVSNIEEVTKFLRRKGMTSFVFKIFNVDLPHDILLREEGLVPCQRLTMVRNI